MYQSSESTKEQEYLYKLIDRQIDAIAGSIYGLFFAANKSTSISLHDILNRIMLLLQAPVTFILCKKHEVSLEIIYRFNPPPFNQSNIDKAANEAIRNKKYFSLFRTQYYLIVLLAVDHNSKPSLDKQYKFTSLWIDDSRVENEPLIYKLTRVLDTKLYEERFGQKFLNELQKVLAKYDSLEDVEKSERLLSVAFDKQNYAHWKRVFNKLLSVNMNFYNYKEHGLIDKIYELSRNGLLWNEKTLPNFIFFIRHYSGIERCKKELKTPDDSYNYDLRLLICSKQNQDLYGYFSKISTENSETEKNWYLNKYFPNKNEKLYNLAVQVNNKFWSLINSPHGIERVIENLEGSLGKQAYSMSDPVFKGGIINFRNPSVNGGLHRAFKKESNNEDYDYTQFSTEIQRDLLRIVTIHYVFKGMSHSMGNEYRIMLCPIELGGRILAVAGYVTTGLDLTDLTKKITLNRKKNLNSKEIDTIVKTEIDYYGRNWRNCYHIYNDLYIRFKRYLRLHFLQLYIEVVSRVCADIIIKVLDDKFSSDIKSFKKLESYINSELETLTQFFCYSSIKCNFISDKKASKEKTHVAKLTKKIYIKLDYGLPSFPSAPGRDVKNNDFIDLHDIATRLESNFYSPNRITG